MASFIEKARATVEGVFKDDGDKKPTVLVTGPSGFVGYWVARKFLEAGYNVRGTFRSKEKADSYLADNKEYYNQITVVVVEDVAAEGAFDDIVKDVDYIAHVASPFHMNSTDPSTHEEQLFKPAIQGTLGIVKSAHNYGKNVKKIVITSSFASVINYSKGANPGYNYTEKDWLETTYDEAKETEDPALAYSSSKKFAEKAAWDYLEKEKPQFDMATIHPPMIFGPPFQHIPSLSQLNESSSQLWGIINGSEIPDTAFPAFVDVRDVAQAHVEAINKPEAKGRFLTSAGNYTWDEAIDIIAKANPDKKLPKANPEKGLDAFTIDSSRAEEVLGIKFLSKEQVFKETAERLYQLDAQLGGK